MALATRRNSTADITSRKNNGLVWFTETGGIIGVHFFKNETCQNVTVKKGTRYRAMITDYLLSKIEAHNPDGIRFQQDGKELAIPWLYCANDLVNN